MVLRIVEMYHYISGVRLSRGKQLIKLNFGFPLGAAATTSIVLFSRTIALAFTISQYFTGELSPIKVSSRHLFLGLDPSQHVKVCGRLIRLGNPG
jgi:hypothetical protein